MVRMSRRGDANDMSLFDGTGRHAKSFRAAVISSAAR
jgi:hypothetical protein